MNLLQMRTENNLPTDEELMNLGYRKLAATNQLPIKTKKELALSGVKKPPVQKDYSANRASVAKIAESIPAYNYLPNYDEEKPTSIAIEKIKEQLANEQNIKAQSQPQENIPVGNNAWLSIPTPEVSQKPLKSGLAESAKNTMQVNRDESLSNKNIYEKLFEEEMRKAEKEGRTNILYENPYETSARIKSIKESGIFSPQERGIEEMRGLLGLESQAPTDILTAPITGLLQTEFGREVGALQQGKGMSPEQQRSRLLGYGEKIQDDIKDLMAKYLEASKAPKIGTTSASVEDVIKNIDREKRLREVEDKLGMNVKQAAEKEATAKDPASMMPRPSSTKAYDPTRDLEKHQKRMQELEPLRTAYDDLMSTLNEVIPGGVSNWNPKIDIPGVGEDKIFPSFMLPKKGSEIRQKYANLKNSLIYAKSGKQINESEYRRLSEALGSSIGGGDRELVMAIIKYGKEFKEMMKQREAAIKGAHPEVIDIYKKGGGTSSENFIPPSELKYNPKFKQPEEKNKNTPEKKFMSKEEFLKQYKGK